MVIFLGFSNRNISKASSRIINFGESYQIGRVTSSSKYVGLTIHNLPSGTQSALIFSKQGKQLYRKDFNCYVGQVFINEKLNKFYVYKRENIDYPEPPNSFDDIIAYDLSTGEKLWTAHSIASRYETSPDQQYIIPVQPLFDHPFNLEIIDLFDGSKLHLNIPFNEPSGVAWYDNDRIVLVYKQLKLSDEYLSSEQVKLRKKIDNITQQRKQLLEYLKEGNVNVAKTKLKLKELYEEREILLNKENEIINSAKSPNKFKAAPSKLILFNIKSNNIEKEKELFDNFSNSFIINQAEGSFPVASVGKKKNIYLLGVTKTIEGN